MADKAEDSDPLTKRILDLCDATPKGLSNSALEAATMDVDIKIRVGAINKLLGGGVLDVFKKGTELHYRRRVPLSASQVNALRGIQDPEEKVLYKLIADAGNKGVWLRDLRTKSNLAQTQVTKILKALEGKKAVKAIRSVSASKKKVYILYDLEPDKSLTGGAWFSDQEFESEFVDVLMDQVLKFLRRKSALSTERNEANGPLAVIEGSFVTVAQVHQYIGELGISTVPLTIKEVDAILEALILDHLAEKDVKMVGESDGSLGEGSSGSGDKDESIDDDESSFVEKRYRSAVDPLPIPGFVRNPCGVCPIADRCCEFGSVTPLKCQYLKDWLAES